MASSLSPRGRFVAALTTLLALTFGAAATHAQTQITLSTASTAISWTNVGGAGSPAAEGEAFNVARVEANLVNGTGLSTDTFLVHEVGDNWVASNLVQRTGGLLIDLGANYQIGTLQIWALNDAGVFGNFSPTTFDFYYTTNSAAISTGSGQIQVANLGLFTQLSDNTALAEASHAAGYRGETYTFGSTAVPSYLGDENGSVQSLSGSAITARYLFLDDLTGSTAFGGRMGFSEIQVYTYAAAAVPEPATYAAILGAGALGAVLVLRRRRAAMRR